MGKHHDKDFKIYAARLVLEEGRKPRELAEELDISIPTLRNWVNTYKENSEQGFEDANNVSYRAKTDRRKGQNNQRFKRRERDIKKGNVYFYETTKMILNHKGSDIEYIRHYEKPYFIFFTKLK